MNSVEDARFSWSLRHLRCLSSHSSHPLANTSFDTAVWTHIPTIVRKGHTWVTRERRESSLLPKKKKKSIQMVDGIIFINIIFENKETLRKMIRLKSR